MELRIRTTATGSNYIGFSAVDHNGDFQYTTLGVGHTLKSCAEDIIRKVNAEYCRIFQQHIIERVIANTLEQIIKQSDDDNDLLEGEHYYDAGDGIQIEYNITGYDDVFWDITAQMNIHGYPVGDYYRYASSKVDNSAYQTLIDAVDDLKNNVLPKRIRQRHIFETILDGIDPEKLQLTNILSLKVK